MARRRHKALWQWILIYLITELIVSAIIYQLFFAKRGYIVEPADFDLQPTPNIQLTNP